jgi:hypothetical protein
MDIEDLGEGLRGPRPPKAAKGQKRALQQEGAGVQLQVLSFSPFSFDSLDSYT